MAFARARQRVLWSLFAVVVVLALTLALSDYVGLFHLEESGGWMMFFASLPWSIIAIVLPQLGLLAAAIMIAGLGINAVAATTIVWWWFERLRGADDTK